MNKQAMKEVERVYANAGQHAEYVARYTLTGEKVRADNKAATACADVLDIQIKSYHATVCKGTDIRAHVKADKASRYGYVTKDFTTLYIMSPEEYVEMVDMFGVVDKDSTGRRGERGGSNGGGEKLRLKRCEREIIKWFEDRL